MAGEKPLKDMYRTMSDDPFPQKMEISFVGDDGSRQTLAYEKATWEIDGERKGLRYGENPGQPAAMYSLLNGNLVLGGVSTIAAGNHLASDIELLQSGKHPGKTNITDIDNALNILRYLNEEPCAVIVKHNNPCGVAQDESLETAYHRAYMADRVASFGGAIALNRPVDKPTAEAIASQYAEVVAAPEYEEGSFDILAGRKNLRIMRIDNMERLEDFVGQRFAEFKSLIDGSQIVQLSYVPNLAIDRESLFLAETIHNEKTYRVEREPTQRELDDMIFGWLVEAGVTSNSVLYVKDKCTVGIGTGEQDRVGVAEIARDKAYRKLADRLCFENEGVPLNEAGMVGAVYKNQAAEMKGGLEGSVMVSDAFFPFRDAIDVGLREGVTAVIQPGGSGRDFESIEACNEYNATMMFTGQRSFKH